MSGVAMEPNLDIAEAASARKGWLARRLACLSPADRRDLVWLAVGGATMGFFTGLQSGAGQAEGPTGGLTLANAGMILATLAGLGIIVRHWLRISARQDEMYRRIEAIALQWAGIAVVALAVVAGLLELHLGAPVVPIWVAIPVFLGAVVAGSMIAARRFGT